jgi:predicted Zn-dependent protease
MKLGLGRSLLLCAALLGTPLLAGADRKGEAAARQIKDGDTQVLLGDDAAAKQLYEDALATDPGNPLAATRLAYLELRAGRVDEAVKLLTAVTARPGAPAEAHQLLGTALAQRGDYPGAAKAFEAYLAVAPDDYRARRELARVLAKQAEAGDAAARAAAVAAYEKARASAGDDSSFRSSSQEELLTLKYGPSGRAFLEGRTAYANGDYRGAVVKLEQVTQAHPEIEEAHYVLGMAYLTPEINRRRDAMQEWERAPGLKEAQLGLGRELHADGDLQNAEARVRKALALDPGYQEGWYYLGLIFNETGKTDDALAAWEKAARIDPESETGKWAATKWKMVGARGADGGAFQEGQVIDPASEMAIGQKFEDMALEYFGGRIQDERLVARMGTIWDRLVAASDRGDLQYRLFLVNSPEVNAFCAPGGRIFMTRGLIDAIRQRMGDRDEYYAAVLGHELAHGTLRHMPEKWKYVQTVVNDPRAKKEDVERAFSTVMTGMTRQSEYEADQYGALYMYRAGYNPRWAMDLHVQFRKVFGEIPRGLDHPAFEERSARLKDFLIELRGRVREFERGNKKFKDGDYVGAARSYEIFLAVLPKNAAGHMNLGLARHRQALSRLGSEQKFKRSTDIDPDARAAAIELHSTSRARPDPRIDVALLREAAAEYRTALRLDPRYALARINLGALLLDLADVKAATQVLEAAVKGAPRDARAWNNLGVAYAMGKDRRAQAMLEKAAAMDGKLADPWFNLGVVHADAGKKDEAAAAFDKYAALDKDSGWSKKARAQHAALAPKPPAK